ncbi:ankyrin repeat-containing protein ITN1-like protein, partial [Tanacetum coccineum]
ANKNVNGIAKELRKLHREGINNATNSVTVVAVFFTIVAFAAIFTIPGDDDDNGMGRVIMAGVRSNSWHHSKFSNSEVDKIYAI